MKKVTAFIISALMLVALAACGSSSSKPAESNSPETTTTKAPATETESAQPTEVSETADSSDTQAAQANTNSNILVVYFSRTGEQYTVGEIDKGNTAIVAEMIAKETGADLFEILPEEDYYPYTYDALTDVAKQEQNENARPAYQASGLDLSSYDTVFVGAPVWWGDWPMIMYTFFENEDLSGKTLIPFSTHEGSGLSGFDKKLATTCPESKVVSGLAIRGNDAQNNQDSVKSNVREWIAGLDL